MDSTPGDAARAHADALAAAAHRHRAIRHPYLAAMARGTLPDPRWALADFARHYYAYSKHFPRYLSAVISRLEDAGHRQDLLQNLSEESGCYTDPELEELASFGVEPSWIVGVPHPHLFRRFRAAIGADRPAEREADQVTCWRELFLALLAHGTPAEAVGALGLGTEGIVRRIYEPFVAALARCGDLPPRDTAFFTVHVAVDDHHEATLLAIAADFAATEEGRTGLRRGMLKALSLRSAFWDWLHERALDPARADEVI
jgi:pyrroloquinoline quinone (PQQ) biosynthesis protein C